jgi:hypothetical protein
MQEETTRTLEAATQAKGEAEAEAKIGICTACFMSEIQTIGQGTVQFFWNPRNDPETETVTEPTFVKRGQSHIALVPAIAIIGPIPHIASTLQLLARVPVELPHIPFPILPTIQLHLCYKPEPFDATNHYIPSTTAADNIPHSQHSDNPAKNRAQCITTFASATPRILTAKQKHSNLRNHPHNHGRLQFGLPKQATKARILLPS